jgi:WD40 repeat protein/serine/threonine protein kinase
MSDSPESSETVDLSASEQATTPPAAPPGGARAVKKPKPTRDIPESIGHYRILECLGEGGMGLVYKAEQREPVRRVVALKVIKLGMDTKDVVARFDAERQALAMMNHPNVARVFEAGMTETGRPYFAMEHVAGVPLTEYCDSNKLTTRRRLELFIPICHAVQHAHQKGIIHRDLKPSNILVGVVDGKPVPKVIDFGIAKATNQQLTQHTVYTQTGALIGTPEYMSPEQAKTSGLDVDTRTDIYSLGVILYELLTGTLPFDPETLHRAGYEAMARIIREEEPQKPSTKLDVIGKSLEKKHETAPLEELARRRRSDFRSLMRELRGDLDWIVLRAMEKDRTRRYESAAAMAEDVEKYLRDEPVSAGPPSNLYRFGKFARRNRGLFITGTAVTIALVLGLMTSTIGFVKARNANSMLASANSDLAKKIREVESANAIASQKTAEAQAHRLEAEKQRNAAQIALAEGYLAQGDALDLAGRWSDAGAKYADAFASLSKLNKPTTAAELALWSHYANSPPPLLTLNGSGGAVRCVTVSRDGRFALSGGEDHILHLWDLRAGYELRGLAGHAGDILAITISADSHTALSTGEDKSIRLWDLDKGTEIRTFAGHGAPVFAAAYSPDGKHVLSASADHTLRIWNLDTAAVERMINIKPQDVTVAFSSDGKLALSGSADPSLSTQSLTLWDLEKGTEIRTFTGHTAWITSIAFSPDATKALSASDDQTVKLWDLSAGKELATFRGHTRRVSSVSFSSDGSKALTASDDGTLKLWDVKFATELRTFRGQGGHLLAAAFLPDSSAALSGSDDHTLALWDVAPSSDPLPLRGHSGFASALVFSPDGRLALTGGYDNTVILWDVATGLELSRFSAHSGAVLSVAFSPDGKTAISGSGDQSAELWDLATGSEIRPLSGHSGAVISVAFSLDGHTVLTASADQTIKLWDVRSGSEIRTYRGTTGAVTSVAFSPTDPQVFASAGEDKLVRIWDVNTGQPLRTLTGHTGRVLTLAYSSDGHTLVSGSDDKNIRVWNTSTGDQIRQWPAHAGAVLSLALSPDNSALVSGGEDRALKLWDLQTGTLLRAFTSQSGAVLSVALAPEGLTALTACYDDQTIHLWSFLRGREYLRQIPLVSSAQETLRRDSHDADALATLARWYAFRNRDDWALDQFTAARSAGAKIPPLLTARALWRLGRNQLAARDFTDAVEGATDNQQRQYLSMCVQRLKSPKPASDQ